MFEGVWGPGEGFRGEGLCSGNFSEDTNPEIPEFIGFRAYRVLAKPYRPLSHPKNRAWGL